MGGLEIAGGIGLTLFGVRFFRKGLNRLFGEKLEAGIVRMTATPIRGFAGGILAGIVAPSSTGISLFVAQMPGTGRLTSQRMLALLLGAGVGMTLVVQLLAFHITDYAGLLVLLGVIGFQFLKHDLWRGIGQCLLSLGFIFFAIGLIGAGARSLTGSPQAMELFRLLDGHPWITLFAVAGLTVLLQSSTSVISLGLGLASSGLVTASALVPWIVAANLGLGITSLLAAWNRIEGRRMGIANLGVKFLAAVPLLLLPGLANEGFNAIPGSYLRQSAMFHTAFNLFVGLMTLPFLARIDQLTRLLLPSPEERRPCPGSRLSETLGP